MEAVLEYIKQFNWVDILVAILLIRICYVAVKTGFPVELFKLLGTVSAIYLACHYYVKVGAFLNNRIPLEGVGWLKFSTFLAFLVLGLLGYFVFMVIRNFLMALIKMEAISLLNRWGALMLGVIRAALFVSLLLFTLAVSNSNYLKNSLTNSFLSPKFLKLTPAVYGALWNNLLYRFMNKQAFNKAVFEVLGE
ncbi:MAG: hypothetical protein DRP74_08605 [Candidatus Omnitrophota bacterium]|nr:MAG: hypothetical protein DRP74_08605 [Candidatus Omnitrophota bacterium]